MTAQASRRTRLYFPGALLAVLAATLLTFTDVAWRGLIGWALLLASVLVMVTGGLTWRQQKENTRGR